MPSLTLVSAGRCIHVSEDMQPSVPDGWRCAVLASRALSRSAAPAALAGPNAWRRRSWGIGAVGWVRAALLADARPPVCLSRCVALPSSRAPKVGQLPASSCAHALTPLTGRCAAPKAHAWAQHARSRLAHAHLTAARSRQWRSPSAPTATWPSRRRRRGAAPHSCLAPNRTAQPAHALGPLHALSSHRRRPAQVCL